MSSDESTVRQEPGQQSVPAHLRRSLARARAIETLATGIVAAYLRGNESAAHDQWDRLRVLTNWGC